MKTCRKCGQSYPREPQYWSLAYRQHKQRLSSPCQVCRRAWQAEYRATEHGKRVKRASQTQWRAAVWSMKHGN